MKVFYINSVPYGSTGRIMFQISEAVFDSGGEVITSSSYTKPRGIKLPSYHYQIGGMLGKTCHITLAKLFGKQGTFSTCSTKKLVEKIKKEDPDIIHLHNLHAWYLNLEILFDYLKTSNKKIVWTLHDCWSFTGHCPHYLYQGCYKWIEECKECPLYKQYPGSLVDDSNFEYNLKKRLFTKIPNLTLVTPSNWLKEEVKKSFLKDYDVRVIHNGIDTNKFRHVNSDFKKKYNLEDKKIILGVAFVFDERKGIDDFIRLANELDDSYKIVLVGQANKKLPDNILSLGCTSNVDELVKIYSSCDVFVNATKEDNFPTVNLEAQACGLTVVTYDVGGCKETIDEINSRLIKAGNYNELKKNILDVIKKEKNTVDGGFINTISNDMFKANYLKLYRNILNDD